MSAEELFQALIKQLHVDKPGDRSLADRAFAIVITQLELAYAYYRTYVLFK